MINGIARKVEPGFTVARLLERDGEPPDHVLVEINGTFLPIRLYEEHELRAGDRVEVILPAFGG